MPAKLVFEVYHTGTNHAQIEGFIVLQSPTRSNGLHGVRLNLSFLIIL
ncbi:uncharacterized protein METZ01_LOCUS95583 [marine metagenome]|uniref:Uncharacterized protein n=1 Tax=marine metagenome TaxID=408172 RepID=A0A381VR01_9ZZZZ